MRLQQLGIDRYRLLAIALERIGDTQMGMSASIATVHFYGFLMGRNSPIQLARKGERHTEVIVAFSHTWG